MKPQRLFLVLGIIGVASFLLYSLLDSPEEAYQLQVERHRAEKDEYMRNSPESPFTKTDEEFSELHYYPVDESFRVIAELIPVDASEPRTLATSDGKEKTYAPFAWARFDMQNKKNELLILEIIEPGPNRGILFLAFGDNTSGVDTYGGGRYLDLPKIPRGSQTVELDFNKAYNPYCAYTSQFSCPLPPRENLLNISIIAGEKKYH